MRPIHYAVLWYALVLAGCDGDRTTPMTPVSPSSIAATVAPLPPLQDRQSTYWRGNSSLVSSSGPRVCGGDPAAGATRADVTWRVTISGNAVLMEEDMANYPTDHIPYAGSVTGGQFTASYFQGNDYLRWACQFRGGELSGNFSPDFSSFEAVETLVWGAPGVETTVQRRWHVVRF